MFLVAAAALWGTAAAILVLAVPDAEGVFRDQDLSLPAPTRWVLAAGHWADAYWYILPLFALLILPVVLLLSWLLRHQTTGSLPGWLWFGALLGVPLLLQLGIWLALLLP
jgi:type II secretory pathway component PulF